MLRNMVQSLVEHERIVTTEPKAKELKRVGDQVVGWAKKWARAQQLAADYQSKGSIEQARQEAANAQHNLKQAHSWVRQRPILIKLLHQLGPRYLDREGGYTRVLKVRAAQRVARAPVRSSASKFVATITNDTNGAADASADIGFTDAAAGADFTKNTTAASSSMLRLPVYQLARRRAGDQAPMAVIEYVDREGELRQAKPPTGKKGECAHEDGVVELLVK
mmetsp:Transcript_33953/g.78416  ORF Transcript_33953/g.78416 Transcript_33953/m.78416 type:complete len:221 (+) Transcript_33953:434-1096(+)